MGFAGKEECSLVFLPGFVGCSDLNGEPRCVVGDGCPRPNSACKVLGVRPFLCLLP